MPPVSSRPTLSQFFFPLKNSKHSKNDPHHQDRAQGYQDRTYSEKASTAQGAQVWILLFDYEEEWR